METEDLKLDFTDDAIDALADVAVHLNSTVENIGARRLQTVMERVLDDISCNASDRAGVSVTIDADYVREHVGDLANQHRPVALHPLTEVRLGHPAFRWNHWKADKMLRFEKARAAFVRPNERTAL